MIPGPAPVMTIQPRSASCAGEVAGLGVERVVGRVRAEPKIVTFGTPVEGPEHGEGGPHLLQRGGGDLEVEAVGVVAGQPDGRAEDVPEHVAVGVGAGLVEQLPDRLVHLGHGRQCTVLGMAHCSRCGAPGEEDGGVPLGWSQSTGPRGVVHLCAECTRRHVRDIEAKLDEEWW